MATKNADLERNIAVLEGQIRAFHPTLRAAEASAKSLRDEAARQKTLVSQVRLQCANDIRKRDIQMQKMKERLNDTRRGTRAPIAHIVIDGGECDLSSSGLSVQESEPAASLEQDSVDFLSKLSQTLADENDNLIVLLRQCLSNLRALQGLPDNSHIPGNKTEVEDAINPMVVLPANHETLSVELERVLHSLRNLINQPNYVPVEELEERDTEIVRLKQRNETLREEWKKAINLVDGWNRTLARGASPVKPAPETQPLAELFHGQENRRRGTERYETASVGEDEDHVPHSVKPENVIDENVVDTGFSSGTMTEIGEQESGHVELGIKREKRHGSLRNVIIAMTFGVSYSC